MEKYHYFKFIPKPNEGRRIVISDIHGCSKTFKFLLDNLKINKNDQLFLLGDFIHKGRDNRGVLDIVINLQSEGYQVFPLRGNHEEIFLEYASLASEHVRKWNAKKHKTQDLFDTQGNVIPMYYEFIKKLPYFYTLDKFYLVHAGFDFEESKPFEAYHKMTWIRKFKPDTDLLGGRQIVYGHVPTSLNKIEKRIKKVHPKIPLDNGCVMREAEQGNLLALDLDTMQLTIQPNMDITEDDKDEKSSKSVLLTPQTGLGISLILFQRVLFSLKIKRI